MRSGGRRHSRTCPKPWSLYNIGSQRFVGLFQQRWGNSRFVDGSERTQPGEPLERGLGVGLRVSVACTATGCLQTEENGQRLAICADSEIG